MGRAERRRAQRLAARRVEGSGKVAAAATLPVRIRPPAPLVREAPLSPAEWIHRRIPKLSLDELARVRDEAEARIGVIVRASIADGSSWAQVARELGLSKQLAHYRYARVKR